MIRTLAGTAKALGFADRGSPVLASTPQNNSAQAQDSQQPSPQNVPIGSSPENVADNIPAKLSEGEFVMPADVVKFYGVNHFQKLIEKAKEGMLKMAQSGLIKGNGTPVPNLSPQQQMAGAKPQGAAAGGFFAPAGHERYGEPVFDPNADQGTGFSSGGVAEDGMCAKGGLINKPSYNVPSDTFAVGGEVNAYALGGLSTSLALPQPSAALSSPALHIAATTEAPGGKASPIGFKIPHNTGIVKTGVKGPYHRPSFTKLADGGFLSTDNSGTYSAGGMPGGIMIPQADPVAPMTTAFSGASNPAMQPNNKVSPQGSNTYPYNQ